jgi:hypothetical protein
MPRLLKGVVGLLSASGAVTHEGAAAFDLSVSDPLMHLVFTKGAALLEPSFYRTQAEELRAYAKALLAAERHEAGFGWKFAAYMRDPERGKGNRIQGSLAPAILGAAAPESPFVEEYVYRCLRHRPDDVTLFIAHGKNLGLPLPGAAARRGMARALAGFDDYQILKYARKQAPLLERRTTSTGQPGPKKTLRLVDAMGICKAHLDPRLLELYAWLHAPTRERAARGSGNVMLEARRRFFRGSDDARDFALSRLTHEQAHSFLGSGAETWRRLLDVDGLVGDLAFLRNLRAMHASGLSIEALVEDARKRRFEGVWPHQVYAGYRAAMEGSKRVAAHSGEVVFERAPVPELASAFEAVLERVARELMPRTPSLGLADLSGSMFGEALGGAESSLFVGDVSCLFSALMAQTLGYCASFADDVWLVGTGARKPMQMADELRQGPGMGGTQVAGAVRHLLAILLAEPARPRPRTLFFFSDMQFHPPASQTLAPMYKGRYRHPEADGLVRSLPELDPRDPPLLAVLKLWREHIGPVDVVLWNLAAYDASPTPSGMDHVLLLSGFDANSFDHVRKWQDGGSRGGTATADRPKADPNVELDVIRRF